MLLISEGSGKRACDGGGLREVLMSLLFVSLLQVHLPTRRLNRPQFPGQPHLVREPLCLLQVLNCLLDLAMVEGEHSQHAQVGNAIALTAANTFAKILHIMGRTPNVACTHERLSFTPVSKPGC